MPEPLMNIEFAKMIIQMGSGVVVGCYGMNLMYKLSKDSLNEVTKAVQELSKLVAEIKGCLNNS